MGSNGNQINLQVQQLSAIQKLVIFHFFQDLPALSQIAFRFRDFSDAISVIWVGLS